MIPGILMVYHSIYLRLLKTHFSRTGNTLGFSNTAETRGFDKKKYIYTQTHFVLISDTFVGMITVLFPKILL